jgi:predicted SAM-dependent methyltransferase
LPPDKFPDASTDVVFSEMMLEHMTPREAWLFLEECYRILKPGGLIRIVIPDFSLSWRLKDPDYMRVNQGVTGNDGTLKEQMKSILFSHHHKGLWNSKLLHDVMESIGFLDVRIERAGESRRPELVGLEQHHKSVGVAVARSESGCVEGIKP